MDWFPWGEEALARARDEDRPILLSIGYSACHWCHVMERESFEDAGDGGADERALRLHQARPRGAARPRLDLHGGLPGDDRAGRLAAQRVPHARAGAVLRGHVLPAGLAHGHAELALGARRGRQGVGRAARGDPRGRRADRGAPARRRPALALGPALRRGRAGRRRRDAARPLRPRPGRLRRGAQVPARLDDRVPAPPRRDRDDRAHAARDGVRRDVRPGGRRLRALLGGPLLARPPLREDALRQRAARARVSAWLAGDRRAAVPHRHRGDARLGAARDARPRGRLLLGARRRLRGRGGQVLRLVGGGDARGPRGRAGRRRGDRLVRRHRPRQLRGQQRPGARARRARAPRRVAAAPVRRASRAGLARPRRQAAHLLERPDDLRAGRRGRGARARRLPRRGPRGRGLRAARAAR